MPEKRAVSSLMLAAILAIGFVVVWGLIGMWAVELAEHVFGEETVSEALMFKPDGTPWVVCSKGLREKHYRDLDGKIVPAPDNEVFYSTACWLLPHLPAVTENMGWGQRVRAFSDGRSPAVYWYLLSDGRPNGGAYFVGYDSQSKECIGYLSPAGFGQEIPPEEEQFPFSGPMSGREARVFCLQGSHSPAQHPQPGDRWSRRREALSPVDVHQVGRDGKIYHADLHERTVTVALDQPGLRWATLVSGPMDQVKGTPTRLAARIGDSVLVLDERGSLLKRYRIPESLLQRTVNFQETTTGEGLLYWQAPAAGLGTEADCRICWSNVEGGCREASTTLRHHGWLRSFRIRGGAVVPSPLVLLGLVGLGRPPVLLEEGVATTYPAALRQALEEFAPALGLSQLIALGLSVMCYRRQVRYGVRKRDRVIWALFVLLLGLPGWIGYRFGRAPGRSWNQPRLRCRSARRRPRPLLSLPGGISPAGPQGNRGVCVIIASETVAPASWSSCRYQAVARSVRPGSDFVPTGEPGPEWSGRRFWCAGRP